MMNLKRLVNEDRKLILAWMLFVLSGYLIVTLLTGCVGTVYPKITYFRDVTISGNQLTSGIVSTDPKTGLRTVTSDVIERYQAIWPIYHTMSGSASLQYGTIANGLYTLDAQHFTDYKVMNILARNGIQPSPIPPTTTTTTTAKPATP